MRLFDADVRVSTFATRLLAGETPPLAITPPLALLTRSRKSIPMASKRPVRRVVLERVSRPLLAQFLEQHAAAFFEANSIRGEVPGPSLKAARAKVTMW